MKYFNKKRFNMWQVVFLLALVISGIAVLAYASSVTIPNTFSSGTTISSSQMNNNFTAIKTAVDDNDSRITSLESAGGGLVRTTVLNVNCTGLGSFTSTYGKIADIGNFAKQNAGSTIEITFNGRIYVESFTGTGAVFEVRVDDTATTNGRARATLRLGETGGGGTQASITGIFTGLSAATHTVSIWVRASTSATGTNAFLDSGCWNADHIVVKEFN